MTHEYVTNTAFSFSSHLQPKANKSKGRTCGTIMISACMTGVSLIIKRQAGKNRTPLCALSRCLLCGLLPIPAFDLSLGSCVPTFHVSLSSRLRGSDDVRTVVRTQEQREAVKSSSKTDSYELQILTAHLSSLPQSPSLFDLVVTLNKVLCDL